MKKYGAIDIGTNSMRILLAQVEDGRIVKVHKDLETTRIGENVDKTGELSPEAIERSLIALEDMIDILKKDGLKEIPVIATSAVRDAKNRDVFLDRARKEIGVEVEVISGIREAQLGFLGVLKGLKEKTENILVIDIGGGSTEFILGNEAGIQHMISLNIGAVRMTEKYITTDPTSQEEIYELTKEINEILASTIEEIRKYKVDRLIGIGGTVTTIASVTQEMEVYDRDRIHNFDLTHLQIQGALSQFLSKNLEERKKMKGLQPKRADVIAAGTVILDRILTMLGVEEIRISEYDNLEGLVFEQMNKA